jgi:hypothetical protein
MEHYAVGWAFEWLYWRDLALVDLEKVKGKVSAKKEELNKWIRACLWLGNRFWC